jgi:glyoxylase-like metal-dependent hydrolase (beta-lactamase superfamily II)
MDVPVMFESRTVAPDTEILPSYLPVPGMGVLADNAYLIFAAQPVLVDAGVAALRTELVAALEGLLDPAELRWIWVTHADPDHIGGLAPLLERAPNAKIVTNFLGMGKLGLLELAAPDRFHLINPGQLLDVGDRELLALRPPLFDAPETMALLDTRTRALFSSDCFGGLLREPCETAAAIALDELRVGMVRWATVDAPWLSVSEPRAMGRALEAVRRLEPSIVLSSHLPPARGITDRLLLNLSASCGAPGFEGPDQAALEQMLAAVA